MFDRRWTKNELALFDEGLSDTEIVLKTGRTAMAVYNKRRKMKENEDEGVDFFMTPPCLSMTQEEKEDRIHKLAERFGVKLLR